MAHRKMGMELSARDANLYVKLAGEATDVASPDDFKDWAQTSVRNLFPHEMLIAGVAQQNDNFVAVNQLLPVDFPMHFIEAVTARRGTFACPTLETWFQQGQPQLYEPSAQKGYAGSIPPAYEFDAYKLKNVAAHGVSDFSGRFATYFSFSQIPKTLGQRHADLLKILVPQ
jgi:hypothetical protein